MDAVCGTGAVGRAADDGISGHKDERISDDRCLYAGICYSLPGCRYIYHNFTEDFQKHGNIVRYTARAGAVLMILMGLMMMTGKMNGVTGYLSTPSLESESVQNDETKDNGEEDSVEEGAGENTEEDSAKTDPSAAVDFTLTDQYGQEHRLSDYRGRQFF